MLEFIAFLCHVLLLILANIIQIIVPQRITTQSVLRFTQKLPLVR